MDKVTIALISAFVSFLATLIAVCVRWGLSNISDESKHMREERLIHQQRLEDKYAEILVALDLSIRNSQLNNDDKLANANAIIKLLGNSEVTEKYKTFSKLHRNFGERVMQDGKFSNLLDARFEYKDSWDGLLKAYQELSNAMRKHVKSYDLLNVRN
ncbi:hypothetical protein MA615_004260 [Vibrio vulnificus]|uniref:hypothetical protein n=1 Tax=Vibrio vulnificus TaxID=672 RepID=UPI00293298DA|nr:hypothetical protein [Vibrio vulnificus]EHZ2903713.1 hypothetical protein [Vibrio vulnificus]EIA1338657.1 hypothetical protein [Vibrio vulnificus]EIA1774695.1 hypothetical protein [Vibrio vulnificus]EIT7024445.1 hypothetical protein [Vibrio vulnificus]